MNKGLGMKTIIGTQIEAVVKPILEEMGLYKGNEVSAKDIFEKYLLAFPQGIKPLWKFQIIVMHELKIYVKSRLFEGPDEIYVFSHDPPKNDAQSNGWDWKTPLMPTLLGKIYSIFNDEELVVFWLYKYEYLYDKFENPKNKLYLYAQQHEEIAEYWLRYGKHNAAASTNPIIIRGQEKWDQFLKGFVYWESKAGDKHTVRHWLC